MIQVLFALYENIIILELMKKRMNNGKSTNLYFWRDRAGKEVDCIFESSNGLKAIEIKASSTIHEDFFKHLHNFEEVIGTQDKFLVYQGDKKSNWNRVSLKPTQYVTDILNID